MHSAARWATTAGLVLCIAATSTAARAAALQGEAASVPFRAYGTLGFELDALPFATGGYYGSVWLGSAPWRLRAVVSHVNVPDFATQPGYEDLRLDVGALIVDRFIGRLAPALGGPWVGAGLETWESQIARKGVRGGVTFHNLVATAGAGHLFYFSGAWYVNPWFALHQIIGGDTDVSVGGHTYHPTPTTGEVSLKLGWHF